jgi:hypothetical protein
LRRSGKQSELIEHLWEEGIGGLIEAICFVFLMSGKQTWDRGSSIIPLCSEGEGEPKSDFLRRCC